ncbi:MAG: hypothetical protein K6F86_00710 [Lachnospiraceae bacterium]|nr:hypothetical protein [Lachnospiraceae bacterium]
MDRSEWKEARDQLVEAVTQLGFPKELGMEMAKNLGSPKAIDRMTTYLHYVKPKSVEVMVDEMISICSEIEAWRQKKKAEEANSAYNDMLFNGLD